MRETIRKLLDFLGIHKSVNKIRFFFPRLLKMNRLKRNGISALLHLTEIFEKNNSYFWLEFGTLLGAYRDLGFIRYDTDIDLGVFFENKINNLNELLKPRGFKKTREIVINELGTIEETYVYGGISVDIFYFFQNNNEMICYSSLYGEENWREVINTIGTSTQSFIFLNTGFKEFKFYNYHFKIPINSELHLQECYGDYNKKIKNWTDDRCPNRKITNFRCHHYFFK